MTSYVSGLIYKQLDYLPFVRSFKEKNPTEMVMPRLTTTSGLAYSSDLDSSCSMSPPSMMNRRQAANDTPPPYDRIAYTQIVDRLIESTLKAGYSQHQQLVNRQSIMQGIKLVGIAVDEFDSGNEAIALDIYLSGLDKIIMSLPNLKDTRTKNALKEKLISLEDRVGIISKLQQQLNSTNKTHQKDLHDSRPASPISITKDSLINKVSILSNLFAPTWLTTMINNKDQQEDQQSYSKKGYSADDNCGDSLLKFKRIGRIMTDIIVQCVVLFKQSPLPGLLYLLFTYFLQLIFVCNQHFQVIEKVQNVGIICIKKFLAADEKYHLHEFASEALHTIISATLKAIVAYKETPGFMEQQQQQQAVKSSNWIWPTRSSIAM